MTKEIDAKVFVHAAKSHDGEIIFQIKSQFSKGGALNFWSEEKGDIFKMLFILKDGRLDLQFLPTPGEAFWVSKDNCPTSPSYDSNFEATKVINNGKHLLVVNRNQDVSQYYYTLRFKDQGGNVIEFDPIIDNRNSGPSKPIASFVIATAVSAVALLIGFVAGRFL